jgi:hypothetical protein
VRPMEALNSLSEDAEHWPSSADASTLLLSLEALARWREHVALTGGDDMPESLGDIEHVARDRSSEPARQQHPSREAGPPFG